MKTPLYLFVMFLSLINVIEGQNTIEFNKQWNVADFKIFSPNSCTDLYSFRNDTTINSIEYLVLYVKRDTSSSANWEPLDIIMREDSLNRIYIFENGIDKILYDFNLVENDTFQVNTNNDCEFIVQQVDSIQLLNGDIRKRITLIKSDEPDPTQPVWGYNYWIQGIGSSTSLYKYTRSCFTDYPYDLLCHYENGEIIYSNPNSQECFITPVENISISDLITIHPNPTSNEIHINSTMKIDNIKIFNLNGQLLISETQEKVNLSHLNSGLYFVQIFTEEGSITKQVIVE